ncbi:MAG TPA: S46 family peptidase [Bacteroidetes bacterium]|nr:S46 family peptidase [Bacteroidota bacterium]
MKRKLAVLFTMLVLLGRVLFADEGMWIPLLLEKYNIEEMQEMGFRLTAEDVYSINRASMKDAVVIFGGGCTGELISDRGLLLTNHHCGYGRIQAHSTLEHDYLTHGFWAMSPEEELPNPGLTATFLVRMEDVTERMLEGIDENMPLREREKILEERASAIIDEAVEGTHYTASVRPFFQGNQYFLFVNEVFRDVRLVGAPPSAIGKFGGDTDNWEWPRHTGDFSLFRIYADKNNRPAEYSPGNVPYRPKKFFPVSLKGVQPGDFTMVFGYPGSTARYVPSDHIEMLTGNLYPKLIEIRDEKLAIMNAAMEASPAVRIQYAAKNASLSNSWKRWMGEMQGLEKMQVIERKKAFEREFSDWVQAEKERRAKYGRLLAQYDSLYSIFGKYNLLYQYYNEVFFRYGAEIISFAGNFRVLEDYWQGDSSLAAYDVQVARLQQVAGNFFDDYHPPVDRQMFAAVARLFETNVDEEFHPEVWKQMKKEYGSLYSEWSDALFEQSWFDDASRVESFLAGFSPDSVNKLIQDPAYRLSMDARRFYNLRIVPEYMRLRQQISELDRLYMKAQMEFREGERLYPDANFTLRVSYGQVMGYEPRDAVIHRHYTTLAGVIEKDDPDVYDYRVPEKLKTLYREKDFGRYAEDGQLHVCFLATNHTTGGNSGSPVINADGHLIGINFDRVWEGVMSDLMFNPEKSRNISLDIRYVLFLIDKYAGAGYLIDEMMLVE